MFEMTRQRIENAWIFALAASTAPLTFLAAGPCGLACGGCPLGGACLLTSPAVFGLVLVIKAQRKASKFLSKMFRRSDRKVSETVKVNIIPVLDPRPETERPG